MERPRMGSCCPIRRRVRSRRPRYGQPPRRNGDFRRSFVSAWRPGCSRPPAAASFCSAIRLPARSQPPLCWQRRFGQLLPTARIRLVKQCRMRLPAASRRFRRPVLRRSRRRCPPHRPPRMLLQRRPHRLSSLMPRDHPLSPPHPPSSLMPRNHPLSPPHLSPSMLLQRQRQSPSSLMPRHHPPRPACDTSHRG